MFKCGVKMSNKNGKEILLKIANNQGGSYKLIDVIPLKKLAQK
jgi:hypothetical protein